MEVISEFQTSVRKALAETDPLWENYDGLVICGTHAIKDLDVHLEIVRKARENKTPTLGICWGMQLMAIEYARNVVGFGNATTAELEGVEGFQVVYKLNDLRVGIRTVNSWWGTSYESHWHHYAVAPDPINSWEKSTTEGIVEIMRMPAHPFFVGVQFHPEYGSSIDRPHPLLADFLRVCKTNPKK